MIMRIRPSNIIIKEMVEIFQWNGSVEFQKIYSQENIELVRSSVVEEPNLSISRRFQQVGLMKPQYGAFYERT